VGNGLRRNVIVDKHDLTGAVLRSAAGCWFSVTVIGQWLFLYYIVARYAATTLFGHFEGGKVANIVFAAHVLFAAVVAFGGLLQLVPQIRERAIAVHRWNGRAFLVAATVVASGGLYMKWRWVGNVYFNWVDVLSASLNAVLILVFVAVAWRAARVRDIDSHRRWALRTFMVVHGSGYFIRIATAGWSVFAPGVGISRFGNGPMNYFLLFASYLLPLAVLEIYLRARDSASAIARFATAIVIVALTAYTTAGTLAATMARRAIVG
jgi:hypothetical protein